MKKLIFILFILLLGYGHCQNIDSLKQRLASDISNFSKFQTSGILVKYLLQQNPVKAQKYADNQLRLADNDSTKAIAHMNLGLTFDYQYNFSEAISNYHKSLAKYTLLDDSLGITRVLLNMGIVNYYKGDLDSSIFYYVKTLGMAERINETNLMSSALSNLGTIHRGLEEFDMALRYHLKSLKIEIKLGNRDGEASSYNNIALCYRGLKEYNKSLEFYNKCLEIRRKDNDSPGMAIVLTNIGQLYYFKKEFKKSLTYNLEALSFENEIKNEIGVGESYVNIGDCYLELGNLKKSIEYLEKALITSEKFKTPDLLLATLEGLSEAYSKTNEFEKAFEANHRYSSLQDSLFKESRMKQVKELEVKYQTNQAEKENELLTKENVINNLQLVRQEEHKWNLYFGIALMLLILILVFYAYRNNRSSSKKLALRSKKIELMNGELQLKNKSITDSIVYAKRIQEAILPQDKFVKQSLPNSFILYKPKDIVSGDFYWMEQVEDSVLFAAVDCTGHGVPGAFMSIVGNNGLNRAVRENKNRNPEVILDVLNEYVIKAIQQQKADVKDGMDIALCNLNTKTNLLKYSGAFNPLYLIRDGVLKIYKGDRQPIGDARRQFTQKEIDLQKDDICYIFTDGYADQFGGIKDKKFNLKRFKRTLLDIHTFPLDYQREQLERIFEEWKGKKEQLDDICVIGFKV